MTEMLKAPWRAIRQALRHAKLARETGIDALLASYPKSGRTWFRYLLANYFVMAADRRIALDLHNMFTVLPNFSLDNVRGLPAFGYADMGVPLVAVTHEQYDGRLSAGRPVVFLVRDPRDVMVSAYFHETRHKHRYHGDIDSFVRHPSQGLANFMVYLNGWSAGLESHPHHVLSYEALSRDPATTTAAVLRFLGQPADDALIRLAVDVSKFDTMQRIEQATGIPDHDYDRTDPHALRARRGQAGAYGDYLGPKLLEWMDIQFEGRLSPAAKRLLATTSATR